LSIKTDQDQYLRCPNDPTHDSFVTIQDICCEFRVELNSQIATVNRTLVTEKHDLSEWADHGAACKTCKGIAWEPRRPLPFVPGAGTVLLCDFSTGFREPEMVKVRPVVVISERNRNNELCVIVPISSVEPLNTKTHFVKLIKTEYRFLEKDENFAKCDVVNTVRLSRLGALTDDFGKRIDSRNTVINAAHLAAVRAGVGRSIGLA
jgi:mRNA interferase MazF